MTTPAYFNPIVFPVCQLEMKNRIALAPMTNRQRYPDGSLSEAEAGWLLMRAEGGMGMIITAGAFVNEHGRSWAGQIGIHNTKTRDAFLSFTENCKTLRSLPVLQLFHGGSRAMLQDSRPAPSPSGWKNTNGDTVAYAMQGKEVVDTIGDYVQAAIRAKDAGFSGVEIHGAHGYLVHQFLSTKTNLRNDEWGGNSNKRERFLLEIIRQIRQRCGNDFLLGVRLSPEDSHWFYGIDFDACVDLSSRLAEDEGVDYIHISLWDAFKAPDKYPESEPAITHFRKHLKKEVPVMTAGNIWTAADANIVREFGADLLALGRVAIAHPDWARKAENINYSPGRPPFTKQHLKNAGVNPVFIEYMYRWPGFVASD
jgi:2,4-dienoyl-CoA reductase-like NADH-dependent reductase (Old Yellow Enzyme family)